MTSLKDVPLKDYYFSPSDDVVQEFFIPVLKNSETYDRAAGFFTSYSLIELSIGVCDLAERGGKIRIITSPRLNSEDIVAIKKGYDLAQAIGESMVRDFERPEDMDSLNRLALLAELISKGILEMKIAVMKNIDQYPDSMFHAKFGLMGDSEGNTVSFTGSMNESRNGLGGNWDHIDVSSSNNGSNDRVSRLREIFENLWDDNNESVAIFNIPEIVQDLLNEYRSDRTLLDLDKKLLEKYNKDEEPESVYFKSPDWLKSNIRPYQKEAIQSWIDNDYHGIFNMATGTGKTKTALCSLEKLYNNKPNEGIVTVIVAPQKHLVDQWAKEIKDFGVIPIVGHSDSAGGSWKEQFRRKMVRYRISPVNSCLVTTIASFSTKEVQEWISKINNLAIVVDEAHNMGSDSRLTKLPENAKYRLALSATLERHNDSFGTLSLKEYFGNECIDFPLEEAIGRYLTNYNYYPIPCVYSESEYNQMISKNESLDSILNSSASERDKRKAKEEYVRYSYTLNSKMESKFDTLKRLMNERVGKDHFLVYSGKVQTDEEGEFDNKAHDEFIHAIDKCTDILGMKGLGLKISRITYRESAEDRRRIIAEFDKGETQGIVAISCLDEGVDIPSIHTAIIMSSSDNPREYIQRRGRVLRLSPGKDHADLYDLIVLPKALDEVRPGSYHEGIEKKILAKEIRRMVEFSRCSLNSEDTEILLDRISNAYSTTINEIIETYGVSE